MSANVYLVGMPGAGKSTVAPLVASRLGMACVDLDALVESEAGRTIGAIFADGGEEAFRDLEARALADAASVEGTVVSCGGGVVLREPNRAILRASGRVAWLDTPADVLDARTTGHPGNRPLLTMTASLAPVLEVRRPFYEEVSSLRVDGTLPTDEIAAAIAEAFA